MTPQDLQGLLDELEASNFAEAGMGKPPGVTLGVEGRRRNGRAATGQEDDQPGRQADQRRSSESDPGSTKCPPRTSQRDQSVIGLRARRARVEQGD